jgi:hypothetical protein
LPGVLRVTARTGQLEAATQRCLPLGKGLAALMNLGSIDRHAVRSLDAEANLVALNRDDPDANVSVDYQFFANATRKHKHGSTFPSTREKITVAISGWNGRRDAAGRAARRDEEG